MDTTRRTAAVRVAFRRIPLSVTLCLPLCVTILLASCGFGESSSDAGEPPADDDDRYSILSEDGSVKLGLTEEVVYMRLSDEMMERVDEQIAGGAKESGGIGGAIRSAVAGAVSKGLRTRITFAHDDIRDVRWDGGLLIVELDGGRSAFGDMEVNGEEVEAKFGEDDARAFIEEWRKVTESGVTEREGA